MNPASTYDEVRAALECAHDETALRVFTAANGTEHLRVQCLACGERVRDVKRSALSPAQLAGLEPWDEALRAAWQAHFRAVYLERAEATALQVSAARRAAYDAYLRSPEWRAKRQQALNRDRWLCQGCRQARATEVHHLGYSRLFHELLFDLVSVCRPCHEAAHGVDAAEDSEGGGAAAVRQRPDGCSDLAA